MDVYLSLLSDLQWASGRWRKSNALGSDAVSLTFFPVTSSGVERYTPKGSREINQTGQGK